MEKVRSYKDLEVWKKAIALAKNIYEVTETFPANEIYSLTSQLRRAAVSVPSNIAEGQARRHTKEFIQFLHQSLGSLAEIETQFIIAKEIGYLTTEKLEDVQNRTLEIQKMIFGIISKLNTNH